MVLDRKCRFSGESVLHGPVSFIIPDSDNSVTPQISETYGMLPNYPNPFNPSTTIQFRLAEDDFGTVSIYNLKGQRIKEIYEGEFVKMIFNILFGMVQIKIAMIYLPEFILQKCKLRIQI